MEEWQKGEGGTPRLCEALGGMIGVGTESERTIRVRDTTRAERAKSVEIFAKVGSSGVQ